jgi:hypothetical protein
VSEQKLTDGTKPPLNFRATSYNPSNFTTDHALLSNFFITDHFPLGAPISNHDSYVVAVEEASSHSVLFI